MRAGNCIRAPHDLEPRRRPCALQGRDRERNGLLHRREPSLVVVADPFVLRAVLEIIAEHQAALWVEVRPALRHEPQHLVRRKHTVLDLRAAGKRRRPHALRAGCVDERPQPLRLRLSTYRVELLLRQRLRAPVANALRREDLDEVGAFRFTTPHNLTQRVRR